MALIIEPVGTKSQLADFITLPRRLYDGMPGYVAPLDRERYELLDPKKNSFFAHGSAQYWIARCDGRAVGRVSAQIDEIAGPKDPPALGLFGCLDTVDDGEVVAALLGEAESWLRARGRRHVRGPFMLSINGESGLLVEGQAAPPVSLLTWHPAYLDARLREVGYAPVMGLLSYELSGPAIGRDIEKILARLDAMKPGAHFVVRDFRLNDLARDGEIARRLFNDAWQDHWGFTPMTESDVRGMIDGFKSMLFSGCGFFIETAGEPVAFMLTIPNLFDVSGGLGPAPGAVGLAKLVFRLWRQSYKSYNIVLLGVASKYRDTLRGARLASMAIAENFRRLKARGAEAIYASWTLDDNKRMIALLEQFGMKCSRRYNVYEKPLTG
jgi:hypothetical protein